MSAPAPYIPARGDVVWIDYSPQAGHEQYGRRPGLVVSRVDYNRKTGLVLVCPITSKIKGYSYEVSLPPGLSISGVVLADQVKNLDWRARRAQFACTVPAQTVSDVRAQIFAMLR